MKRTIAGFGLALLGLAALYGCTGGGGGSSSRAATVAPIASGAPAANTPAPRTKTATVVARFGEGFLEMDGTRKILHTKGTSYERGLQYGYLVGDEVEGVFASLDAYVASQINTLGINVRPLATPIGSMIYKSFFDADALEELRGILDGMRLRNPSTPIQEHDLIFINAIIDLGATVNMDVFSCSTLAVWGSRTKGGKLFQTRVVDLMVGTGLENHVLTVVAKPEGGVPYINLGWAGMIGCASGLNAHGLGVGQVWARSNDVQIGRPWPLQTREILAYGTGVEDAERVMRGAVRTYGSNFVFADRGDARGGTPRAIAVETTAHLIAVFGPDDPREDLALWNGQPYAIRMPEAVFRGDSSMDPAIRARQLSSHGPTGDPRSASAYKNRYEGQAVAIRRYETQGIEIGPQELIDITQEVTMKNDSLQCCVYANDDLEVWVANARLDNGQKVFAYQEPYYNYSLDYYTPTAQLVPDKTTLAAGETFEVAVPLETLGSARRLDLQLVLEAAGGARHVVGKQPLVLGARGLGTITFDATLPASVAAGPGQLVLEVLEGDSQDLVDLTVVPVTVR